MGSPKKKRRLYQNVKLPAPVLDELAFAKIKIANERKRLERVKEIIEPERCPVCGGPLKKLEVKAKVEYVECEKCGFKQPKLSVSASGTDIYEFLKALGLGTLVGLGVAALLYLVFGGGKD